MDQNVAVLGINFDILRGRLKVLRELFAGVTCVFCFRETVGSSSGDDVRAAFRTQPRSCLEVDQRHGCMDPGYTPRSSAGKFFRWDKSA